MVQKLCIIQKLYKFCKQEDTQMYIYYVTYLELFVCNMCPLMVSISTILQNITTSVSINVVFWVLVQMMSTKGSLLGFIFVFLNFQDIFLFFRLFFHIKFRMMIENRLLNRYPKFSYSKFKNKKLYNVMQLKVSKISNI